MYMEKLLGFCWDTFGETMPIIPLPYMHFNNWAFITRVYREEEKTNQDDSLLILNIHQKWLEL